MEPGPQFGPLPEGATKEPTEGDHLHFLRNYVRGYSQQGEKGRVTFGARPHENEANVKESDKTVVRTESGRAHPITSMALKKLAGGTADPSRS